MIAYTNESGYYTIAARPGNQLTFSYVGYNTVIKATPGAILVGTLDLVMSQAEYQLPEYRLRQSNKMVQRRHTRTSWPVECIAMRAQPNR